MHIRGVLKKARLFIVTTVASAALSSLSLSLIPIISQLDKERQTVVLYVLATVFWGNLLLTIIGTYYTQKSLFGVRRQLIRGYIRKHQRVGIVSFSKDWKMLIVYGVTIIGMLLIISDIIWGYTPETIMLPILSITMFLFIVHCIVDGKYYKAYKLIKESLDNETKCKA